MLRTLRIVGACTAVMAGLFWTGHSVAHAYGAGQLYELTYSANCDNPSVPLCAPPPAGFGLGGAWGWIELDGSPGATSGTADATLTFCSHGQRAFHVNLSNTPWIEMLGSQLPPSIFPVDFPGSPSETYLVVPAAGVAFPVTPGHYAVTVAPGVQVQSQVVALH